jgi:hypothetical protein
MQDIKAHLDSLAQHKAPGISSLRVVVLGAAGIGVCTMLHARLPSSQPRGERRVTAAGALQFVLQPDAPCPELQRCLRGALLADPPPALQH